MVMIVDTGRRRVEVDARKCRSGFFFVWALQEIDQSKIARAFTSCQTTEATSFVYYVAAPRPKGGFYLLTSRTSGSGFGGVVQQQLEEMDAKVRAAIMIAVNKAEQPGSVSAPEPGTVPDNPAQTEKPPETPPGRD